MLGCTCLHRRRRQQARHHIGLHCQGRDPIPPPDDRIFLAVFEAGDLRATARPFRRVKGICSERIDSSEVRCVCSARMSTLIRYMLLRTWVIVVPDTTPLSASDTSCELRPSWRA